MPTAKEAALKALAVDGTVADAHAALAMVLANYEWNWAGAEREYRLALESNPGDAATRSMYARLLASLGRFDDSTVEGRRAIERDPLSNIGQFRLSYELHLARRFDAALVEAQAGIELDPSFHIHYYAVGVALVGLGRYEEAVTPFERAVNLAPEDPMSQTFLGWAYGVAGHRKEALALLGQVEKRRIEEYVPCFFIALVNLGLGQHEEAISRLERAAEDRDSILPEINVWPGLDPLRADPRVQALLRRMNFPETAASG